MRLSVRISQYAGCAAFFFLAAWAPAEDIRNFIDNGGFEELAPQRPANKDQNYRTLVERDVAFPRDAEAMPESVALNPGQGWMNDQYIFQYVQGTPGAEVHSGSSAIKITSPIRESAVILGKVLRGKVIPVVKRDDALAGAIQVSRPYKYSFDAKGQGSVRAILYMYESVDVLRNLYDYAQFQTVEPTSHEIGESGQWNEYTGTVTLNSEQVGAVLFVLLVKGEVSIDDVQLTLE
jgi:hypothetical protein